MPAIEVDGDAADYDVDDVNDPTDVITRRSGALSTNRVLATRAGRYNMCNIPTSSSDSASPPAQSEMNMNAAGAWHDQQLPEGRRRRRRQRLGVFVTSCKPC